MREFIKYCFYCLTILCGGALGTNPEGMSFKTLAIGFLTALVLICLLGIVMYLLAHILVVCINFITKVK